MMLLLKTTKRLIKIIRIKKMKEEHGKKNKLKSRKEKKMKIMKKMLIIRNGHHMSMDHSRHRMFSLSYA
jgi:hypothetical protein